MISCNIEILINGGGQEIVPGPIEEKLLANL